MTLEEAEEYAKKMPYRNAVYNALQGKCIPYRKATIIKLYELLDIIEQEPCKDCISRENLLEQVYIWGGDTETLIEYIKGMPSVKPQESKIGHWEDCSNGWMCSVCERDSRKDTNYCPNCGARMCEPQESEE